MSTKIVKASDPTIMKCCDGYYFDPIINQAYSAKVPGVGTSRLYTLKPTKSGSFRFSAHTFSVDELHRTLKLRDPNTYAAVMAQATNYTKTTIKGEVKVLIFNEAQFNQVVSAFQTLGYDWAHMKPSYKPNMVGIIAGSRNPTSLTFTMGLPYFNCHPAKLLTISELMEIAYPENDSEVETKWYDLKPGDKVKINGHDHVYTIDTVESKTYDGDLVVEFTERIVDGDREGSYWATKSTKYVKVNSSEPCITQPPNTKGWIIGNLNSDSKIEISDNPKIHDTIEATETERDRLMNKHIGQTFVILEIKSYGKIETNPVTKIW